MTTATTTEHDHNYTLPKTLKVDVGTVLIPTDVRDIESLTGLKTFYTEVAELLSLLPEGDLAEAEVEEDGFHVTTDNQAALLYATNHYLLDEFGTAVDVVLNLPVVVNEEVCETCVDDFVEEVADRYTSKVLSGAVYLVKEDL